MRKLLIVSIIFLSLCGCKTMQSSSEGPSYASGQRYTAPDSNFSVNIPLAQDGTALTLHSFKVQNGDLVRFTSSAGSWFTHGGYAVEWRKRSAPFSSDSAFFKSTDAFMPKHLRRVMARGWGVFDIINTKVVRVGDKAAHQYFGTGNVKGVPMVWVATAINFSDHIAFAYVVSPQNRKQDEGTSIEDDIPWAAYDGMMHSIN